MINTGNVIVVERDSNQYSQTYNTTRTRTYRDTDLCPVGWKLYYTLSGYGYYQGMIINDYLPCSSDKILSQSDINGIMQTSYTLESVTIGSCVEIIGDAAFSGSSYIALGTIDIPNNVVTIGERAFQRAGLNTVNFGTGLETIGNSAFVGNYGLKSVTLPDSVISIGDSTFYDDNITTITLGNSIETIGNTAFYQCDFATITLPSTLKSIGSECFYNCAKLTSVTCLATTPPTSGSNPFRYCTKLTSVYVPAESVDAYKSTSGWSSVSSKIQAIPS